MTKMRSNALLALLAALLIVLGFIAFAPVGKDAVSQPVAGQDDPREAIALNDEQLEYVLAQMRGFLVSVQDLDSALYENDFQAIAQIAAKQAPGAGRNPPSGLRDAFPDGFNMMRKQMRGAFARMEQAALQSDPEAFHAAKQRALSACNACHEGYRFVPEPE